MVYTNPIVTSDVDELYPEDPIAVFEAESAVQMGYEPIPQEPDFNQIDASFPSGDIDENDDELEQFVYNVNNLNLSTPDTVDDSQNKSFPPPIFSISNATNEGTSSEREIDMDDEKVEEVKQIMISINLPCSIYPDWLFDVPEEEWKDYILRRLHLKKEGNPPDKIPELVVD